jgi:outer membrane protein assembly factor BamB
MRHLKWSLWLCALLFSGLLSSCSLFSKKTGQEPMDLVKFKQTVQLKKLWEQRAGDGQGVGLTQLTPALDGNKIFTVDHEGLLKAMDREKGKILWSKNITNEWTGVTGNIVHFFTAPDVNNAITGGVSSGDGILFVGNYAGEIIALSAADGKEIWRKQLKGEISSVPQTNGEVVAVQTMNGKLFVMDAKTGAELWFFENPPPVLTLRGTAAPLVTDAAIYAGFSNGRLMAFNPSNGLILWEQRMAMPKGRSELDRMVDIHASPLLKDGIIYVGTYQGKIAALARGTGSNIWSQDGSTTVNLAASDDKLFVSSSDGKVIAYNVATGEPLWQNEKLLRRSLSGPQVFGEYLAVVDFEGYLHILKQADGELVARSRSEARYHCDRTPCARQSEQAGSLDSKGVHAPMLSDGNILYVYGDSGDLRAYTVTPLK